MIDPIDFIGAPFDTTSISHPLHIGFAFPVIAHCLQKGRPHIEHVHVVVEIKGCARRFGGYIVDNAVSVSAADKTADDI